MKKYFSFFKSIGYLLVILVFTTFFIGCNDKKSELDSVKTTYVVKVSDDSFKKEGTLSEFVEDIVYILLDTSKNVPLIGNIDKVEFIENKILVLDKTISKSLFIFDNNGKFVQKIGSVGQGPGEYNEIYDFYTTVTNGNLYYCLKSNNKVLYYDKNGKYKSEKAIPLSREISKYNDGFALIGIDYDLLCMDDSLQKIKNSFFPLGTIYPKATLWPFTKTNDGSLLYRHSLSDTIFKILTNKIYPHTIISFSNPIPNEDLKQLIKEGLNTRPPINKMHSIKYYSENESKICFYFYYNNSYYMSLFDKKNKKTVVISPNIQNDVTFESTPPILFSTHSKYFVGVLDPKNITLNSLDRKNRFVKKILDTYSNVDLKKDINPTIILVKFK
ncbi:MAG: 6-bladed beta-propeller [Runella sp.]